MKISIIIPCYNEVKTVEKLIDRVFNQTSLDKEIIVIDDGSTDGTSLILDKIKDKIDILIINEKNFGKGYSLNKGIEKSNGDIVLIQDADLEYDPSDYDKLIKPIISGEADVVYGSRYTGSQEKRVLYFWHTIGNSFLTLLSNMLTNFNLTDMENCYKIFKSEIIKGIKIEENRFGFEPEITAKLSKLKNLRIYEVGVKYYGRQYNEGKKITWKDGFSAIRCIFFYNMFR
ncbi:glycosyltransferase family 2 protein [Candidatus Pelagibacter sp. Uisw_136]|uniref:glycosyltransferase family 2 protein n=1 Tax=Candidatus Pelagibacter sp. Uisw_136 TaxID=3230991 RepID=UPI0039E83736